MTTRTDSPWWIVRPSLAAGLAGSFALAIGVYRFAGFTQPALTLTPRSFSALMQSLSGTPALAAVGLFGCVLILRRRGRRMLQILCALLALASFAGVWLNVVRDTLGRGPIEGLIEKVLANGSPGFAGK